MLMAMFRRKFVISVLLLQFILLQPLFMSAAGVEAVTGWKNISTGSTHNLGVKLDGSVWIWGAGVAELFGKNGEHAVQGEPMQVTGLANILQVAAGGSHSLALRDDGTVWSWGGNTEGELGDGTKSVFDGQTRSYISNENKSVPLQVKGLKDVVYIAAGFADSYAVKKDGTVWAWGSLISRTPVQLTGYSDVQSISIGYGHYAILKKDGTVWQRASSLPSYRDGATQNLGSTALVQIEGLTNVVAIAAGGGTTHALKSDGTVWGWGYNSSGEIGDGTSIDRSEPIKITGIQDVIAIASSAGGPFYLKRDGSLWSNGSNPGGQLGIGSYESRSVPTRIEGLVKIKRIASSGIGFRAMAIRQDNTLWAWGNGYIGDGTKWWRTSPVWIKSNASEAFVEVPLTVELNGTPIDFDQQPVVIDARTMVPLRPIFEALGATIEWNANTNTVTAIKGETTVVLTIGEAVGYINGNVITLEAPAVTINGRTMVPARFVGESFGSIVGWDASTRTVSIDSKEEELPVETHDVYPLDQSKAVGQIVGLDGVGIPGLKVLTHAVSESVSSPATTETDKNGNFTILGLEENQAYLVLYWQESSKNPSVISHNGMNYCRNESNKFTYTSRYLAPIVLEQVQLTGRLIDQNNKPITNVNVYLKDKTGDIKGIFRFSVDHEGTYSLCGLVANETYTVNVMKLSITNDTINRFEYQPLTFTYDPNTTTLSDIKVTITEVKK